MRRTLAASGVLALAYFASLSPLVPTEASARPAAACSRVALVDGALRCDAELDRPVVDGCGRQHVLRSGDALQTRTCEAERMAPANLAALEVRLDPNVASALSLTSLPGVGPVIARRIVQGRPYAEPEDLLAVRGIGPVTLGRMAPRLRFSPRPAP
ncbi:MAG: helix-hairpin-helix domain-containing protein [Myxococcota bacterium]